MDTLQALHDKLKPCDKLYKYAFVSYNWEDRETVWRDIAELQARGYNIWVDNRNTEPTKESWRKDCIPAIEDQCCVLVLFYASKHSLMSYNCFREMEARTNDRTHENHFDNDVPLIVLEVCQIDDITLFLSKLNADLDRIIPENEQQKAFIGEKKRALYLFKKYFFKNNNERIRIRPKNMQQRIGDYYDEICAELDKHKVWRSLPTQTEIPDPIVTTSASESKESLAFVMPESVAAQNYDNRSDRYYKHKALPSLPVDQTTPEELIYPAAAVPEPDKSSDTAKSGTNAASDKFTKGSSAKETIREDDPYDLLHKPQDQETIAPPSPKKDGWERYKNAEKLYSNGQYEQAIQELKEAAKAGEVLAAYELGNIYTKDSTFFSLIDEKNTVEVDLEKAADYYRIAAEAGHHEAKERLKIVKSAIKRGGRRRIYSPSGGIVFFTVFLQILPAIFAVPLSTLMPTMTPLLLLIPFCIVRAITGAILDDDRNMRILCRNKTHPVGTLCTAQNIAAPIGAVAAFVSVLFVLRETQFSSFSFSLLGQTMLVCLPFLLLCVVDIFRVNNVFLISYPRVHLQLWFFISLRNFITPVLFFLLVGSMHSFWLSLILAIPSVLMIPVMFCTYRYTYSDYTNILELVAYGLVFRIYMLTLLGTHETVLKNLFAALGFQLPAAILTVILVVGFCIAF